MIAIIDYQMGNLRSVQKAIERVGHEAVITSDAALLEQAEKLILPGVGAFADAIAELRSRQLVEPIRQAIAKEKPLLGICLGLQLLFDVSHEDGQHEGLGVVPGEVVRFQVPAGIKVPHMGWNECRIVRPAPLLAGIPDRSYFYFVHSYHVVPEQSELTVLQADYPDPFCAMIQRGRLFATQFHPEKSQQVGLQMLSNFAELPA